MQQRPLRQDPELLQDVRAVPERNAAERQIARLDEGATLAEIYAEQVRNGAAVHG